jgi:outer membrane protein
LEVKQAYFDVQQAKKSIEVTRNQVASAEEDLRLNSEKYTLGSGTMLELIDAQVSYATAKSDHIQSLYAYKKAIARLQQTMGKLEK